MGGMAYTPRPIIMIRGVRLASAVLTDLSSLMGNYFCRHLSWLERAVVDIQLLGLEQNVRAFDMFDWLALA